MSGRVLVCWICDIVPGVFRTSKDRGVVDEVVQWDTHVSAPDNALSRLPTEEDL